MFTITPMSQKISLKAGEEYQGSLMISIPADAETDFSYKVSVTPYSVIGTEYDADLATESQRSQIVDWITVSEASGVLTPNEKKNINYTIKVPENAPAGGQYAAITVSSNDEEAVSDGFSVKNVFEIASVVFAEVDGEITHEGEIVGNNIPGFVVTMPIHLDATLTNGGNVHETATVGLTVKNVLTGANVYPAEGESGALEEVIMPETTRLLVRDINNVAPLGIYEVTQNIEYMGINSVETRVVVAMPIWFIVALVVTLGIIVGGIVNRFMKKKGKKGLGK